MHAITRHSLMQWTLVGLAVLALILAFSLLPLPGGIDWETFVGAAQRVWTGQPLYGELVSDHSHFYNPPWVAVLLAPFAWLPFRLSWAMLAVASLVVMMALMRHWQGGLVRTILVLLSPATIYILLHGEIDALALGGILLPQEWWVLVALTKPQVTIGLIFGVPRKKWLVSLAVTVAVLSISLLWFGNWPQTLITQPNSLVEQTWNLWAYLWPWQVPAGVTLILLGITRCDERLLVAASPFLSPYATTSSLLGPWMATTLFLTEWQATIVWASWWGAAVYRALF